VLGSSDGRNALAASVRKALERKVRPAPAIHAGRSGSPTDLPPRLPAPPGTHPTLSLRPSSWAGALPSGAV
jgi:hypothetical protein